MKSISTIFILLFSVVLCGQINSPTSQYFKVDQFGYQPNSQKVAVISNPELGFNSGLTFTPGNTLQLRSWSTNAIEYTGSPTIWNNGQIHEQSGDRGWWFDFSSVTTEGDYYIYDPINDVRSHRFTIDADVYNQVLKSATVMFYRNRCGNAKPASFNGAKWSDNNVNFTQDQQTRYLLDRNNTSLYKDLSGGWFDAGDFNKYVTFVNTVVHDLLWAYEENPSVFGDNWNIPESNNNLPDILDEIKWELDWLMKMNNADGSTHVKMGSLNHSDNSSPLPSNNNDPRYYGPTCSSAEIFVAGIFAHAAKVLSTFPSQSSYVAELTTRAEQTWAHVLPQLNDPTTLDLECDLDDEDNRIVSGDADIPIKDQMDMAVKSAIHLWDLTANSNYKSYIDNNLYSLDHLNGYWNYYQRPLMDALLHYSTLPGVSQTDRNAIRNSLVAEINNPDRNFLGMTDVDLYRSYMPDAQYHWGSNQVKAILGVFNLMIDKYDIDPSNSATYVAKAAEHVHYFHGLNPMGLTYLTNMYALGAEYPANEMYHQWFGHNTQWDNAITSPDGPAPGYLAGGPNSVTSVVLAPPAGQPHQKSYLDFNTVSDRSWEISEPGLYYQSSYVRLLAAFSNAPSTCPAENAACDDGNPKTVNDVTDGFCGCIGECPVEGTVCNDNDPLTTNDRENGACLCIGDLPEPEQNCDNQVQNGDFVNSVDLWNYWGCAITAVNGVMEVANIQTGDNPWDAGISQQGMTINGGRDYILHFTAESSASRTVTIKIGLEDGSSIYYDDTFIINGSTQDYLVVFSSTATTLNGSVEFHFGLDDTDLSFDNIELKEFGCDPCTDGSQELIVNGLLDNGLAPFYYWGSTATIANDEAQLTDITGTNPWDAAFAQGDINYETGKTYTISVDARATANRSMFIKLGIADANLTTMLYEEVQLTSAMQTYTFSVAMLYGSSPLGTVEFYIGHDTPDIILDNVSLIEECPSVSDCPYELIINNPLNANLYQAENSIISDASITQISPVEFGAYNFVTLEAGFEVVNGNVFLASLNGCTQ